MNITFDPNAIKTSQTQKTANFSLTKSSEDQESDLEKTSTVSSGRYDTFEMSETSSQYVSDTNTESSGEMEDTTAQATAELVSESISGSGDSGDSDDSDDSVDVTELYAYTDSELEDLLASGEITQQEYNTEMAKRNVSYEE